MIFGYGRGCGWNYPPVGIILKYRGERGRWHSETRTTVRSLRTKTKKEAGVHTSQDTCGSIHLIVKKATALWISEDRVQARRTMGAQRFANHLKNKEGYKTEIA